MRITVLHKEAEKSRHEYISLLDDDMKALFLAELPREYSYGGRVGRIIVIGRDYRSALYSERVFKTDYLGISVDLFREGFGYEPCRKRLRAADG